MLPTWRQTIQCPESSPRAELVWCNRSVLFFIVIVIIALCVLINVSAHCCKGRFNQHLVCYSNEHVCIRTLQCLAVLLSKTSIVKISIFLDMFSNILNFISSPSKKSGEKLLCLISTFYFDFHKFLCQRFPSTFFKRFLKTTQSTVWRVPSL